MDTIVLNTDWWVFLAIHESYFVSIKRLHWTKHTRNQNPISTEPSSPLSRNRNLKEGWVLSDNSWKHGGYLRNYAKVSLIYLRTSDNLLLSEQGNPIHNTRRLNSYGESSYILCLFNFWGNWWEEYQRQRWSYHLWKVSDLYQQCVFK